MQVWGLVRDAAIHQAMRKSEKAGKQGGEGSLLDYPKLLFDPREPPSRPLDAAADQQRWRHLLHWHGIDGINSSADFHRERHRRHREAVAAMRSDSDNVWLWISELLMIHHTHEEEDF